MIPHDLFPAILEQYQLPPAGLHGVIHWARVLENGRRLAAQTGANLTVVEYFAVFHDACRVNDGWDHHHGERGAALAQRLRGRYFDLDGDEFDQLLEACRRHTGGHGDFNATLLTCWDADRLDLLRVGIRPDPKYLGTQAARAPEVIAWANQRASTNFIPSLICREWKLGGVDPSFG